VNRYRACLSQRYVVSLLAANLLGRVPNGMATLSIVLFLRAAGRPFGEVGLAVACFGLASAGGGPALGRAVDRLGQASVLIVAAVGSAAGFCLLAIGGGRAPLGYLVLCVILAGALSPPLEPALRSLWSSLLTDRSTVEVAYSLDTSLQELLYIAGPFFAVGLFAAMPGGSPLYVLSAAMLAGTLIFVAIPPVRQWRPGHRVADWAGALRSRRLVLVLGCMFWVGCSLGVLNVVVVAYAERMGSSSYSGGLLGTAAIGGLIGGLSYGSRHWRGDEVRRFGWLLAGLALCYLPLLSLLPVRPMFGLMLLAGLFLAPVLACGFVLIANFAPTGTATEAFAWVTTLFLAGSALGSSVTGVTVGSLGLRASFALTVLSGLLALLVLAIGRPNRFSGTAIEASSVR
jgi:predicted MFS family arabinose efflux permease